METMNNPENSATISVEKIPREELESNLYKKLDYETQKEMIDVMDMYGKSQRFDFGLNIFSIVGGMDDAGVEELSNKMDACIAEPDSLKKQLLAQGIIDFLISKKGGVKKVGLTMGL